MLKIKHERTADCVVAGYRTHKSRRRRHRLAAARPLRPTTAPSQSVGVIGAFPMARRKELFDELQPLVTDFDDHPWAWAKQEKGNRTPTNGAGSRWNAGKDLSFTPLRPERVVEVRYDHMEGVRFRHTAQFVRWRAGPRPASPAPTTSSRSRSASTSPTSSAARTHEPRGPRRAGPRAPARQVGRGAAVSAARSQRAR